MIVKREFLGVRFIHRGCIELLQQGWKETRESEDKRGRRGEIIEIWEDVPVVEEKSKKQMDR